MIFVYQKEGKDFTGMIVLAFESMVSSFFSFLFFLLLSAAAVFLCDASIEVSFTFLLLSRFCLPVSKPESVSHVDAAGCVGSGLSAYTALHYLAHICSGETVLICNGTSVSTCKVCLFVCCLTLLFMVEIRRLFCPLAHTCCPSLSLSLSLSLSHSLSLSLSLSPPPPPSLLPLFLFLLSPSISLSLTFSGCILVCAIHQAAGILAIQLAQQWNARVSDHHLFCSLARCS